MAMADLEYLHPDREMTREEYDSEEIMALIHQHRLSRMVDIESDKSGKKAAYLRAWYADHPWDFCRDWCFTYDPRRLQRGLQPTLPFIPFFHQVKFLKWVHERFRNMEPGITLKSRECGVSWLCGVYAVNMFLFKPGSSVLFATRKADELDDKGDPGSLFQKMRILLEYLPPFLLPEDFNLERDTPLGKILDRVDGSSITGESGEQIGRGGRGTVIFIDEAAFLENQERASGALSATSDCQIRVSTPNVPGDLFHRDYKKWKKVAPERIFEFHWTVDPRKGDAWYKQQKINLDPDVVARELDMCFEGSNPDAFIPIEWVESSVDAHTKLGFEPMEPRILGFDPADDGGHAKAAVLREGPVISRCEAIEGRGDDKDIRYALPWAMRMADEHRCGTLCFDADGMGAPTMKIALASGAYSCAAEMVPYKGGNSVQDPDMPSDPDNYNSEPNKDAYYNRRAQVWSEVRNRFYRTHQAIVKKRDGHAINYAPGDLISLSSDMQRLDELKSELCSPLRKRSEKGKIQVESKKDMHRRGLESINLADAFVCCFSCGGRDSIPPMKWRHQEVYDAAAGF